MKNFKLLKQLFESCRKGKTLVLLWTMLLIGAPRAFAWYYIVGDFVGGWMYYAPSGGEMVDSYRSFYRVEPNSDGTPKKYYFKVSNGSKLSGENLMDAVSGYATSGLGGDDGKTMWIEIYEKSDVEFHIKSHDTWHIEVAVTPSWHIKYPWYGETGWKWSGDMYSNGNGTYSTEGKYNSNVGNFNYSDDTNDANPPESYNTILDGDNLSSGLKCFFTLNMNGTPSLTIQEKNSTAGTNYIFFDNTNAGWSDGMQFILGHLSYTRAYTMSKLGGSGTDYTNLYYVSRSDNDWTGDGCFAYFGMLWRATPFADGAYGSRNMYDAPHHSEPLYKHLNLQDNYNYLVCKEDNINGNPITVEEKGNGYSALNFNQTVKYQISTNGSAYADMTEGKTPATITGSSFAFNGRTSVTGTSLDATLAANTDTRYSTTINAAYTGKTTLSVSSLRDGYKFKGWYIESEEKGTATSYTYRPTAETIVSARFEERWAIKGTMLSQDFTTENLIGNFVVNGSGQDVGYIEFDLPGNSSFEFKVFDRAADTKEWYSYNGEVFDYDADNNVAKTCTNEGSESNMTFHTAAAGRYRFTWNATTHQLTVTYPDSYKVTYNDNGITSGSAPTDGDYYAPDATVTVLGDGTMVKSGYTFLNWNTEDHGYGTDYSAGNTFSITEDVTLYAKWQNDSYTGKFTFHDGTPSSGFAGTWNVTTFPASATRTELGTDIFDINYTIPNPATSPYFFVGYEGWAANPLGVSSGQSVVKDWDDNFVDGSSNVHGYLKVLPGYSPLSDGSSKTAQGATGTLTIMNQSGSLTDNLQIGFTPDGYGLTISYNDGSAKTQVIAFHSTENPNLWETDVLDGGLDANKVAGTFKVGLATSSSGVYVDCYQSAAEAKAALDARKVTGTNDITSGVSGRFQILINSSATNFGLRYVPLENVWSTPTSGAYYWNNVTGWSLGRQPTIDEDVIIKKGITVNVNNARAKSIRIDKTESSDAQLRIEDTGALLVVENILSGKNGVYGATASEDINIYTGYSGNGALIVGGESYNTAASYSMYSKSYMYGGYGYINQYVGIPFTLSDRSYFYGAYLFSYDEEKDEWAGNVYNMYAFKAYNIIQTVAAPNGFYMYGTLNLPGIADEGGDQVLGCTTRTEDNAGKMDYLFANSWTAPIEVGAMDASDFSSNLNPTIYIFNAGAGAGEGAAGNAGGEGSDAGNFTAITAGSAGTIPSTQGFMVRANAAGSHTLTLNYKKHVYDPALAKLDAGGISIDPTRAPKRDRTADPEETKLSIRVKGESGFADRLRIRKRADFTNEFDNCFDATKAWGMDEAPQLYAKSGALDMAINAVPDVEGMIVGFRKGTVEDVYTMTFEYDGDETLYLNDLKEQVSILIDAENDYTFTTAAEDNAARFVISATPIAYVPTGIDLTEGLPVSGSHKFIINGQLYIIREGRKYNANGVFVK